jgi:hypothetical protein
MGYPKNHAYLLGDGEIVPSFRLYSRWQRIAALYPSPLTSLLDIGTCRGFFVLEAARRPTCRTAVGIDVHEPFVRVAGEVAGRTGTGKARFAVAAIEDVAGDLPGFGGPFQTLVLLNTYHYLFYGSDLNSAVVAGGHRHILGLLSRLCTDRVIFSSPLELDECPRQTQDAAARRGDAASYTTERFMEAAREFFRVEDMGRWGNRPLLVLHRREGGGRA